MKKRNILFVFRYNALNDILLPDGTMRGPTEFLWGMNALDLSLFEYRYVNAPRDEKKVGVRRVFSLIEYPFRVFMKIGLPLEIYPLYTKELNAADEIMCVNDQISLAVLFWRALGFLKDKKIHCIIMSLQERIKYFRRNKPMVWFVRWLLSHADTVLILSDAVREDFLREYRIDEKKVKRFLFGIDTDFWKPADSTSQKGPYILSIGNDMNRDYDTLIRALPAHVPLKIITKKHVNMRGKDHIEVLSDLTNEEVRTLYQHAAIVVVPSIKLKNESSGLSCLLQTLACRRPLIVSDAPPLREALKENEDCVFYQPEDADDLRKKISLLLNDAPMRERLAQHGYETVHAKYRIGDMGKQLGRALTSPDGISLLPKA